MKVYHTGRSGQYNKTLEKSPFLIQNGRLNTNFSSYWSLRNENWYEGVWPRVGYIKCGKTPLRGRGPLVGYICTVEAQSARESLVTIKGAHPHPQQIKKSSHGHWLTHWLTDHQYSQAKLQELETTNLVWRCMITSR